MDYASSMNVRIEDSIIHPSSKIWNNTRIVDSVIAENCSIADNSHLCKCDVQSDVVIQRNCLITNSLLGGVLLLMTIVTLIMLKSGDFV